MRPEQLHLARMTRRHVARLDSQQRRLGVTLFAQHCAQREPRSGACDLLSLQLIGPAWKADVR